MGVRVQIGVRVHPACVMAVKACADDLNRSEGFIVEQAIASILGDKLPKDFSPGSKVDDKWDQRYDKWLKRR